jgi:DNA-binding NtrC family response regulator
MLSTPLPEITIMKKNKILVVDDEADLCELVRVILKETDYDINCADSLAKGLKIWGSLEPDVVLLDKNLPDGSGLKLIEDFPQFLNKSKVIMITGDVFPATTERIRAAGIQHLIQKPFSLKKIADMVHNIFDENH